MLKIIIQKILLPLGSLAAIASGYYYLWVIPPTMPYADVVTRAMTGVALTLIGGVGGIIFIFRIGK